MNADYTWIVGLGWVPDPLGNLLGFGEIMIVGFVIVVALRWAWWAVTPRSHYPRRRKRCPKS